MSENISKYPECFLEGPETFQSLQKVCRNFFKVFRSFANRLEIVKCVPELARVFRDFSECPKHSIVSRNFPACLGRFPELFLNVFLCSHAKTFWITKTFHQAMFECLGVFFLTLRTIDKLNLIPFS